MSQIKTFTSTGIKLLHHPEVIQRLINFQEATPISIQIAPTSKCNLNCVFCSNVNRDKHEALDLEALLGCIHQLRGRGAKTVEWTGGGDPTQYGPINEAIRYCNSQGLQQGMITNGVELKKSLSMENLDSLTWLRISMNCLDYVKDIDIPEIPGTLGFSYVMNEKTTDNILAHLREYVEKYKPAYVRIVPNCQASDEEQKENNEVLGKTVAEWGKPYFYQPKVFQKPDQCYWGYFKPFILHDGWAYACSSVVLNADADRSFHEKYRWVKMEELPALYDEDIKSFPTENCNHCVFSAQNAMIGNILNPSGMEDFI